MQTVRTFSDNKNIGFGLDKYVLHSKKKNQLTPQNLILGINTEIQVLEQGKIYQYLRIEESEGVQHLTVREIRKKGIQQEN